MAVKIPDPCKESCMPFGTTAAREHLVNREVFMGMAFHDLGCFFASTSTAPTAAERRADLMRCAEMASAQGKHLLTCRAKQHPMLLEAIDQIKLAIGDLQVPWQEDGESARWIFDLASYVH